MKAAGVASRIHCCDARRPAPAPKDVTTLIMPLREMKDAGEIELLKKASTASIEAQSEMMKSVKPGETERAIAGSMTAAWYKQGCERPSYAPIVGTGINSTILHYSENSPHHRGWRRGGRGCCLRVLDVRCPTLRAPFLRTATSRARQREIYNVVLGAQKAAIDAFVAGKSKINDFATVAIPIRSTPPLTTTSTLTARICTASHSASTGCTVWDTWWASTYTIPRSIPQC